MGMDSWVDCMRWCRLGSLGPNSPPANHELSRLPRTCLRSSLEASEDDDYESAGPGSNSRSWRSRVRTHLDIGSKWWLGKQEVASLNVGLTRSRGKAPRREKVAQWSVVRTDGGRAIE
jgi:hypothetical protein